MPRGGRRGEKSSWWGTSAKSHPRGAAKTMICASCGKPDARELCSGCRSVCYCNKTCQRNHWGVHKTPCRAGGPAPPAKTAPPPAGPFVLDLHCGHCGEEMFNTPDSAGIRCGSCARVAYCGEKCQKAHWPAHKAACLGDTKARVLAGEGELAGAEGSLKSAWDKARKELGKEHEETLVCMSTYATFLRRVGRYGEAEPLFREALDGFRRSLGDSHPNTLSSICNLAGLLKDRGKLGEAEPLLREALYGFRRTLGDSHPDTLLSINNLALLLRAQGKLGEAEPLYREALEWARLSRGDVLSA